MALKDLVVSGDAEKRAIAEFEAAKARGQRNRHECDACGQDMRLPANAYERDKVMHAALMAISQATMANSERLREIAENALRVSRRSS